MHNNIYDNAYGGEAVYENNFEYGSKLDKKGTGVFYKPQVDMAC